MVILVATRSASALVGHVIAGDSRKGDFPGGDIVESVRNVASSGLCAAVGWRTKVLVDRKTPRLHNTRGLLKPPGL